MSTETEHRLLTLALAALESRAARIGLIDAIEETGWDDTRAKMLANIIEPIGYRFRGLPEMPSGCRAIAAVLLFGGWSTTMWPSARRCWLDPRGLAEARYLESRVRRFQLTTDGMTGRLTIAPRNMESRFWLTRIHRDVMEVIETFDVPAVPEMAILAAEMQARLTARFPDESIEVTWLKP